MGDRGNIYFVDHREGETLRGVYMYTHWSGSMLPGLVRDALGRGRGRWGDSQYLARIVFCELVQGAVLEETGYGLSTYLGDNEHSIIRVDDLSAHVSFHEPGKEAIAGDPGVASWTYEAYLAAPFAEIERAYLGEPAVEPALLPRAKAKAKAKPKKQGNGKARPKANGKAAPQPAAKPGKAAKVAKAGDGKARPKTNGKGKGAASRGKPARRSTTR